MAKNTSNSAFRKIDIDQYNEDNFREDEADQAATLGPDEAEVGSLLNQFRIIGHKTRLPGSVGPGLQIRPYEETGKFVEALKCVLSNAPLGSVNQQVKDNALAVTLKVLLAIKSGQIEEAVGSLSSDDVDVLMKYIYRGFESPSEGSSGHLLLWHERAYQAGGAGAIVRVLSDRRRV